MNAQEAQTRIESTENPLFLWSIECGNAPPQARRSARPYARYPVVSRASRAVWMLEAYSLLLLVLLGCALLIARVIRPLL